MNPLIRTANETDFPQIAELFQEVDVLHRNAHPRVFQAAVGPPRSDEDLHRLCAGPNAILLVAELNARVVGIANAYVQNVSADHVFQARRIAVIDNITVHHACRRRGIGTALVGQLEAWATSLPVDSIELNVYAFNAEAEALYRSLGYANFRTRMSKSVSTTSSDPETNE
jgi:ribosomal protein S18 acetylase RimI-like enzyme